MVNFQLRKQNVKSKKYSSIVCLNLIDKRRKTWEALQFCISPCSGRELYAHLRPLSFTTLWCMKFGIWYLKMCLQDFFHLDRHALVLVLNILLTEPILWPLLFWQGQRNSNFHFRPEPPSHQVTTYIIFIWPLIAMTFTNIKVIQFLQVDNFLLTWQKYICACCKFQHQPKILLFQEDWPVVSEGLLLGEYTNLEL